MPATPTSNETGTYFGMIRPEAQAELDVLYARDEDIKALMETMHPRKKGEEPKKKPLSFDLIAAIRNFEPSQRNALTIASIILGVFFGAPVVVSLAQSYAPGGVAFLPNGTANATNASDSSNSTTGNFVPFDAQHPDVPMTALFGVLAIFCIVVVPVMLQLLRARPVTTDAAGPLAVVATTPADTIQPVGNGQRAVGNLNRTSREEAESPLLRSETGTPHHNYGGLHAV